MMTVFLMKKTKQHMHSDNENENFISQSASNIRCIIILIRTDCIAFFTSADEYDQSKSESDSI